MSDQLSQQEKIHEKDYKNNDSEVVSKLSARLSQQLAVKDEQIEKLQQLLDQQQQLTLQANKQIEKLQEQILLSAPEEKEESEYTKTDSSIEPKKWWQFWK
ncbi:DUF536 domain-containing protein [Enterococcus sp. AZ128]|uniref:DUF536 domain-containing protein n=1 Tax=unclassified Enterococcus TaxID=2608891 RepID=UPI003F685443